MYASLVNEGLNEDGGIRLTVRNDNCPFDSHHHLFENIFVIRVKDRERFTRIDSVANFLLQENPRCRVNNVVYFCPACSEQKAAEPDLERVNCLNKTRCRAFYFMPDLARRVFLRFI